MRPFEHVLLLFLLILLLEHIWLGGNLDFLNGLQACHKCINYQTIQIVKSNYYDNSRVKHIFSQLHEWHNIQNNLIQSRP